MSKIVVVVVTLLLMVVSGVVTCVTTIVIVMGLGTKFHDNYEYYGSYWIVILLYGLSAIGFLAPGVAVWYFHKREPPWHFSLRSLLVATTLIAVLLGVVVLFFSWLWSPVHS